MTTPSTSAKQILILGTAYPYRGGLAAFIEMLAKKFIARGNQVKIFTFTLQYPSFLFPGQTQFLSPEEKKSRTDDTSYITREVSSVNPFNWFRVGRAIRKLRPDVVILKYWHPYFAPCFGVIARIAHRNGHTRFVVQLDNVTAHESRFFDTLLTRFFVSSMDGFVYMSETVKTDLDRFTQSKPALFAPHPIFENFGTRQDRDESARRLRLDPTKRYVLFFGIVRDYKGLDLLLDAWERLRAEGKMRDRCLLIAGEYYNNKEQYIQQIERLGLEEEVVLHDHFIDDSQVKYYFSLADLLVLPYKSATQSGVTQIAYQFEVPLVVTRVGGLPEIVAGESCGLVSDPDPDTLASTLEKALEPSVYTRLKQGMASEKEKYSWDRMCDTIEQVEALTRNKHPKM